MTLQPALRFTSFQNRLIVFFTGLLVAVLSVTFIAVNKANIDNATVVINAALETGAGATGKLIEERSQGLLVVARLLSADFAFKETYADRDHATLLSAMNNHLENRAGVPGAVMIIATLDGKVMADTAHPPSTGHQLPWPWLISAAENDDWLEAASVVLLDGRPFQMMLVPLLTPDPDAWILTGFPIDDAFASEIKDVTMTEISVLHSADGNNWTVSASTLPEDLAGTLPENLAHGTWPAGKSSLLTMQGEDYVSLATPLIDLPDIKVFTVLQRSLGKQLKPFLRLQWTLLILFSAGLFLSVIAAVFISRSVTRPVLDLADGARRIEEGDYSSRVVTSQSDEIGKLAHSFNNMAKGLAEKERVRNLLGKVVSPAIAEELLSKDIELGGEERQATILFSDVRNFTTLCENRSPQEILSFLNIYLTEITAVIEAYGGVVDKYIGDAVMALFGAPLQHEDDAQRAIRTALGMRDALTGLNAEFSRRRLPRLNIGIGINSGLVVAGNMGSLTRLNYTVIGDVVNLASRLEGLTKHYGVTVIVSESTRAAAPGLVYRELDRVRVKGKLEPVSIHEPLGDTSDLDTQHIEHLKLYQDALAKFRNREWDHAEIRFGEYAELATDKAAHTLADMYLRRIAEYRKHEPDPGWDWTYTYTEK